MKRGWTSDDLPVLHDDQNMWTVAEAARLLGPMPGDPPNLPATAVETKLRILTRYLHLKPSGKRRTSEPGHQGRYARVYHASDFIWLYETIGSSVPPSMAA